MSDDRDDRLVGWKMIADYLARDERTVQRWTRDRGLPVHRLPGGKGASVFAVRAEVEQWLARAPHIAAAPQVSPGLPYDHSPLSPEGPPSDLRPRTSRSVVLTVAASVTFAALAVGGVVTSRSSGPIPETVGINGDEIVAKAQDRVLWRHDLGRPKDAPSDATWRPIREPPI